MKFRLPNSGERAKKSKVGGLKEGKIEKKRTCEYANNLKRPGIKGSADWQGEPKA